MVRIHSNLGGELIRLKRIRSRWAYQARARLGDIPWMETAQGALAAAMSGEETVWMTSILRGLSQGKTDLGLVLRVNPQGFSLITVGLRAAHELSRLELGRPGAVSRGEKLGFESNQQAEAHLSLQVENAEQSVRDWVYAPVDGGKFATERPAHGTMPAASGKVLTEEDDFDPETAIGRILRILGFREAGVHGLASEKRREAARSLTHRIEEFMAATQGGGDKGLSRQRLLELLRVIRDAWTQLAWLEVPRCIRDGLLAAAAGTPYRTISGSESEES